MGVSVDSSLDVSCSDFAIGCFLGLVPDLSLLLWPKLHEWANSAFFDVYSFLGICRQIVNGLSRSDEVVGPTT
ncbi:MAG: hypothetical protein CL911_05635 [Deltaproteobacteria bacterium]|nr:hypothetical protein [Deltaproteobacteria bacterium]